VSARRFLSSAALFLLLVSCARALAPPRQPVSGEARRAIALLTERWQAFSDLRTLARVEFVRGDERQAFNGVLLVKAPVSVRFEALSPFGQPLLLIVVHEGRITAYDAATNKALVGPATADTTARLLGMPFEPDDLVGVLAGRAVPPRDLRVATLLPADELGPSLELIGTVHRQRIWMDFDSGVVHQVEITGGRYEVRVRYTRDGEGRPQGFELNAARDRLIGTVRYRDPVFDGGIEADRFQLTLPDSAKIEQLR
jgi:outer membrane lipoprotein-sorting protein